MTSPLINISNPRVNIFAVLTETFIATSWREKHGSKARLINTFQVNAKNTHRHKNNINVENKHCINSQPKGRIRCNEDNNTKRLRYTRNLSSSITKTQLCYLSPLQELYSVHHTIPQVVILQIVANRCFEHLPVLLSFVSEQF